MNRTQKSIYNLYAGILYQGVSALVSFLIRKIFLDVIGVYFLGLDGLFGNISTVLFLLDFGVGTSATYYLYKANASGDENEMYVTYKVFNRLYKCVSLLVLVVGLLICWRIDFFVDFEGFDMRFIQLVYLATFSRTLMSFTFGCPKQALLCEQENYINLLVNTLGVLIFGVLKVIAIYTTKDYLVYLVVILLELAFDYGIVYFIYNKKHPKRAVSTELYAEKRQEILSYSRGLILLSINTVIFSATDNIVISKFLGVTIVGIMSNYYLIVNSIQLFATQAFEAIQASVSNYINDRVVNSKENMDNMFQTLLFLAFLISMFCCTCLFGLTNQFIGLYFGYQFVLETPIILTMVLNFTIAIFQMPFVIYTNGRGLAKQEIKFAVLMSIINLSISIILVQHIGVVGVLLGTLIANTFMIICRFQILVKNLDLDASKIAIQSLVYILTICLGLTFLYSVNNGTCTGLGDFVIRGLLCILITAIGIGFYFKTSPFKTIFSTLKQALHIK